YDTPARIPLRGLWKTPPAQAAANAVKPSAIYPHPRKWENVPMKKFSVLTLCLLFAISMAFAQTTLSNSDVSKLVKSGLSEDFILNLIDTQGTRLSADVSSLIELKQDGANERIIAAVSKKGQAREAINTDSILRLSRAGFSDSFSVDLLNRQPGKFSTDASRLVELKQAGVSERVLALMVSQGGRELPSGTAISIRLIDAIDSERNNAGDEFRASLEDPIT